MSENCQNPAVEQQKSNAYMNVVPSSEEELRTLPESPGNCLYSPALPELCGTLASHSHPILTAAATVKLDGVRDFHFSLFSRSHRTYSTSHRGRPLHVADVALLVLQISI